jgi:GTPase SAR1 family protein
MQKSPYKFLDSYSKEDRNIFFGRDKEIEEIHSRVFENRILIVYGTSGTGKSSLINCGLANKFNDSDWLPVTIRRGININQSLFDCLDRIGLTDISESKKVSAGNMKPDILKIIQSIYLDHFKPVYLIFDQFEELFIFGNSKEKEELITNIKKVIDSDLQCRFIFSIREEYLAGISEFEKIIPSFFDNRIRIEKMTRQNAMQVIEGPCHLNNITVETGFSEMLLEKLNPDNSDVELTYLQVYLDKVFRMACQDNKEVNNFTNDLLDKVGEVKDLLGSFLEEQISQLDDPESGLVILKSFVSVKGTKHQITEEEVIEYSKTLGKNIGRETVTELIQKFIRLRILRDKDEDGRYELRHDSLAAKIFEKITLVEKELLEIKQFLDNAWNSFEKRQLFLTTEDLKYIAPYENRLFLNEKVTRFVAQSKWSIHKARRRRQNALITAAVVIITVLSFFSIWALKERSNAISQKRFADEQKNNALEAKEAADSARQEALRLKNLAVEKEIQAILAQNQSDEARRDALAEREYALLQRNRAEKLSITANEQALIATEEKLKAEKERSKAIVAEGKARQLRLLSTAQNLALKSSGIEKNPELMGLLAVQAFLFNKNNNGRPEDPIIYEALKKAYSTLDISRHSVFTGSPNEIWVLRGKNNGSLFSADLDGQIRIWSPDGINNLQFSISLGSPINFIGSNSTGEIILAQYDNNDLILWNVRSSEAKDLNYEALRGHKGFVRAIAFSPEEKYLATAGRDSSVITWYLTKTPLLKENYLKTGSGVRAMVFVSRDTLIFGQDDGSLILWNISHNEFKTLYKSDSEKIISLAWNDNKKILIAGSSTGSLLMFKRIPDISTGPDRFIVHTAGIDLITFNSDFSLMATSSWDKTIKFYNYHEFFELSNSVGGAEHIRNLNTRIRSLLFTSDNKLVAGLSDKSIRIWETSSEKLASMICNLVKRDMTIKEWNEMVGAEIPYENTCQRIP